MEMSSICPEEPATTSDKPGDAGEALDVVLNHVGSFGRYQKWLFVAMLPFGISMASIYYVSLFTIATPNSFWCNVPELEHLDLELRRNLSAPGAINSGGDWRLWDRCSTFDTNWSVVLETLEPPANGTPTTDSCEHGWVFEYEDIPYETVVTQRGWVCENASYVPIVQWVFFAGAFTGGLIFGWVADRFGRVTGIVAVNVIGFVAGTACIFTNLAWDIMLCRFLAGMSYDNCFMLTYILVLEYVGAKHRTLVANLSIMLYFGGSSMLLPWVALWVMDWRIMTIVTSAPLAFGILAPFIFPESARWLSSRGKTDRAVKILRRVEHINGNPIPQEAIDNLVKLSCHKQDESESLWVVLVSHPQLRWVLILMVTLYTCCGIVFDGLIRLSGSLGSNMFTTFTLSSATEFPSLILVILLLDRLGRRVMAVGSAFVAGVLSIIAAFFDLGFPRVLLAISARFFANMTFNTTIQWVAEVLPSGARASGSSLIHVSAFILASSSPFIVYLWVAEVLPSGARASGSSLIHVSAFILASSTPFIVYLENIWSGLPFIVIGAVAMLATGVSALLPETRGQVMPHSCADANRLIQNYSLLGKIACCSQKDDKDEEYKS
ncbi:hypothetical protein O0L34_g13688 [Tuta absoluta]|nr:hypothetical protein O0L34_g13688 [Tuta absoluta]